MKSLAGVFSLAVLLAVTAFPAMCRAAPVNLVTLTCQRYQNEVLAAPGANQKVDPINTVMWLFGYSVAKTGAHVMYGDALSSFGFALDAICKNNPNESLQDALSAVKHDEKNPMDLTTLDCGVFLQRHEEMSKNDKESADTIMMWLFGFSVAKSGSHIMDADRLGAFDTKFTADCRAHAERSLFDILSAVKIGNP
jgi:hypothetical protein